MGSTEPLAELETYFESASNVPYSVVSCNNIRIVLVYLFNLGT